MARSPAERPAPRLIIGIGNPSRGDDALGPLLIERLSGRLGTGVELLTDFQLQVEYVLDLAGRQEVVIADAAASGPVPFLFQPVAATEDAAYTTHSLSPAALLAAYGRYHAAPPPPCHVLAIRGYDFELGRPLSMQAAANLEAALRFMLEWCHADEHQRPGHD
ncbi:MAG: hydrogenase maturation protease [Thiobacillaceae bacterium]